jgi:hypothetical protein
MAEPIYPKHRYSQEVLDAAEESASQRADRWMVRCDVARAQLDDVLTSLEKLADKLKDDNVEHALRNLVKETRSAQANSRP